MNDGFVWPLGYCAGWKWSETFDPKRDWMWGSEDHWQCEKNEAETHKHKYHTDGHATKEEAYACYKAYMLDNELRLDHIHKNAMYPCLVCKTFTQREATVGPWASFVLCDQHCNREEVEKLYKAGDSWHS